MHCLSKPSDIGAAWNQHLPQACSRTVLSHHGTCKGTFFSSPLLMRLWGCYHDDLLGYSLGWTCPNTYCQGRSPKPPFMLLKRRFTNRRISDDPVAGSKIFQNKRILQHMHWLWCLTCRMFCLCYACSERSFRRTKNISSIQLANNILLTSNCPMWNTVILLVQAWTRPAPPFYCHSSREHNVRRTRTFHNNVVFSFILFHHIFLFLEQYYNDAWNGFYRYVERYTVLYRVQNISAICSISPEERYLFMVLQQAHAGSLQ